MGAVRVHIRRRVVALLNGVISPDEDEVPWDCVTREMTDDLSATTRICTSDHRRNAAAIEHSASARLPRSATSLLRRHRTVNCK